MWHAFLTGILWIGGIAVFGGFALAFYDRWLHEHRGRGGKVGNKELKEIQTDLYIQKYDE